MWYCKCHDCSKEVDVVFDLRYEYDNKKITIYTIKNDRKEPTPTGLCFDCIQKHIKNDLRNH